MPSLWRLPVQAGTERRVVHAVLARWLDTDHHADRKPWSWRWASTDPEPAIEIGLVDDTLADRLVSGSDRHRAGSGASKLVASGPVAQLAATTWQRLAATPPRADWTLDYVSPVSFRRGTRFQPWPAPAPVFGSLRAAWRSFGAPHTGDLTVDLKADPLIVTAVAGASRTERVTLRVPGPARQSAQVTVTGFVGRVRYTADGPIDQAAVSALVALAPYAGVGAYTTRGFGGTRLPVTG
jgi:CRISPR-associated endoribonuclease Cas6